MIRCRNKFYLELQRSNIKTTPFQRIKLQELDEMSDDTVARIPRTFEIEARGKDLVDKCRVGDIICVVGIVKTFQVDLKIILSF